MKPEPFTVRYENGLVLVSSEADAAFRKALMDGVPTPLRAKMMDALSAPLQPNARKAMREAQRHFGAEANEAFAAASELAAELHRFLERNFQLQGLLDWLTVTGYGNDYRMIKVFYEWAKMGKAHAEKHPNGIILPPAGHG
ncbi:hypothetical protein ACRQ5Q_22360 [Bradyrhizobium sp. PMVTL-01]|uniref:hypothetical protein n=1 Tax=Bradyrhizobium sp. PMVTL-01 TaxID=3434999 RepID=UPI003F6F6EB5